MTLARKSVGRMGGWGRFFPRRLVMAKDVITVLQHLRN